MRTAALVLLATFAFVVAGCGSGGGTTMTPLELVANAATKTGKTDSAKFRMTITETIGPIGPITITADGVSDNSTHSARMTMNLSSIAQLSGGAAGDPADWKGEVIADGTNSDKIVEYMHLPAFQKLIPGAKPWIKLDLSALGRRQGLDFSQLLQTVGSQDPSQALQMIQSVGNVKEVGSEQVDGVDTTKYSGTVDPQKLAAKAGSGRLGTLFEQLGAKEIPVTVWVDGDGYVRKLEEDVSGQVPGSGTIDMKIAVALPDFGPTVDVKRPPADQTTDLAELLKKK